MPLKLESRLRAAAFRFAPKLANEYRQLRDRRAANSPLVETPFGFKFSGNTAMATGAFENAEVSVFLKYLEKVSVCIDVGANIGLYTCLAANRGKQVIAFEPLNSNLDVLYRNISSNNFSSVEVFPLGLASHSGVERLFGSGTGASLIPGWADSMTDSYHFISVSTLDCILNTRFRGVPLLIKMDVEGLELAVLNGAEQTLQLSPRPTWLVEICLNEHFPGGKNEKFRETFDVFWRYGYQARVATDEEQLVQEDDVSRWAKQGHVDFGSHNYLFL